MRIVVDDSVGHGDTAGDKLYPVCVFYLRKHPWQGILLVSQPQSSEQAGGCNDCIPAQSNKEYIEGLGSMI